jgi:hypothetical protein
LYYDLIRLLGARLRSFDISTPIFFVDRIKARRCCCSPERMIRAVPRKSPSRWPRPSKNAVAWWDLKVYENEGHSFARVENQIDAYKRVAEFLKKYVPPADCGCTLP